MACTSLIPNSGDNRTGNHSLSNLAAFLFGDDQPGLKVALPNNYCVVGLVPDSQQIPGFVQ